MTSRLTRRVLIGARRGHRGGRARRLWRRPCIVGGQQRIGHTSGPLVGRPHRRAPAGGHHAVAGARRARRVRHDGGERRRVEAAVAVAHRPDRCAHRQVDPGVDQRPAAPAGQRHPRVHRRARRPDDHARVRRVVVRRPLRPGRRASRPSWCACPCSPTTSRTPTPATATCWCRSVAAPRTRSPTRCVG